MKRHTKRRHGRQSIKSRTRKSRTQKGGWFWRLFKKKPNLNPDIHMDHVVDKNGNPQFDMCDPRNLAQTKDNDIGKMRNMKTRCCPNEDSTPFCKQLKLKHDAYERRNRPHYHEQYHDMLDDPIAPGENIYDDIYWDEDAKKYDRFIEKQARYNKYLQDKFAEDNIGLTKSEQLKIKCAKPATSFKTSSPEIIQSQYKACCPKSMFGFKNSSAYCKSLNNVYNNRKQIDQADEVNREQIGDTNIQRVRPKVIRDDVSAYGYDA